MVNFLGASLFVSVNLVRMISNLIIITVRSFGTLFPFGEYIAIRVIQTIGSRSSSDWLFITNTPCLSSPPNITISGKRWNSIVFHSNTRKGVYCVIQEEKSTLIKCFAPLPALPVWVMRSTFLFSPLVVKFSANLKRNVIKVNIMKSTFFCPSQANCRSWKEAPSRKSFLPTKQHFASSWGNGPQIASEGLNIKEYILMEIRHFVGQNRIHLPIELATF